MYVITLVIVGSGKFVQSNNNNFRVNLLLSLSLIFDIISIFFRPLQIILKTSQIVLITSIVLIVVVVVVIKKIAHTVHPYMSATVTHSNLEMIQDEMTAAHLERERERE